MSVKNRAIAVFLLLAFIGAGVFSFVHALEMSKGCHHTGDCPLMFGEQAICNLNPIEHLVNWQKVTAFNPEIYSLILLILFAFCIAWLYRFFFDNHSPPQPSLLRIAYVELLVDLYTRIYSDGILNPKVY